MVDKELLSRKLSFLQNYVSELKQADDINWEKYTVDPRTRAFVERYLHLAIESVFDIANNLPKETLHSFQEMASFRNILVHRYEKIDDEIVFGVFKKRLVDFDLFGLLIKNWAEKQ